jgi:preprotein translocase SecE subunit
VARQTRAQRRAERAEQAGAPPRRPPRPTADGEGDGRRKPDARPPQPHREHRSFVQESWAELKKVEWPGQSQVIQATVVVLIACIVVGAYLYLNDAVWKPVVQKLIGQ